MTGVLRSGAHDDPPTDLLAFIVPQQLVEMTRCTENRSRTEVARVNVPPRRLVEEKGLMCRLPAGEDLRLDGVDGHPPAPRLVTRGAVALDADRGPTNLRQVPRPMGTVPLGLVGLATTTGVRRVGQLLRGEHDPLDGRVLLGTTIDDLQGHDQRLELPHHGPGRDPGHAVAPRGVPRAPGDLLQELLVHQDGLLDHASDDVVVLRHDQADLALVSTTHRTTRLPHAHITPPTRFSELLTHRFHAPSA